MKSVMGPQKNFARNPSMQKQRSVFNRTHGHKSTFDVDYLVPFFADEILPGDSQDVKANIFARLSSTLDFPIMDNIFLDTFYFFVPNRILWENWERFMGAQDDPGDSIDYQVPQVTGSGSELPQCLSDYLGIPVGNSFSVASFWHRAYISIWNEWFRDENLQDSVTEYTGDGPEVDSLYPLQKRGKRHDYFTSCLPFLQKGEDVTLGLATSAPVWGTGNALAYKDGTDIMAMKQYFDAGSTLLPAGDIITGAGPYPVGNTGGADKTGTVGDAFMGVVEDGDIAGLDSGLYADLSQAAAITVNDFRIAVATQQLLELDARGGTRYFEILKSHFGVTSPDSRLQRAEYLGGSTQIINVNPVTQSSESNTTYQGNQAAYATCGSRSGYSKSFVEHGVVLGLVNVRADLTYQQGINRMFSRLDRYDYYFPSFANLGEQAVLNKEIFHQGTSADDDVFGYQERWAEYRYKPSQISGWFRSDSSSPLDAWHLSQDFATLPVLGDAFITESVPLNRVLTVEGGGETDIPHIIFDSYIEVKHARCMPTYSIPGLRRL